jgi:uncharacterized membrane protein YbjE (DUF340 family)
LAVEFDPFLYLALAAGLAAGYVVRPTSPWVGHLTSATIVVLIALLGAALSAIAPTELVLAIPAAIGLVALLLLLTAAIAVLLRRAHRPSPASREPPPASHRFPLSAALLVALIAGYSVGRIVTLPADAAIPYALYVLLALVGFGLRLVWGRLPSLWIPLTAAVVGAAVVALLVAVLTGLPLAICLSLTMGFGFYSLAGPLVAARVGAFLGLFAFLTNFLRENLTMLLAPYAGARLGGEGLSAWGGATSMDTTLYFVTRFGDADSGTLAIANGLILTIVATVALPVLLALPR